MKEKFKITKSAFEKITKSKEEYNKMMIRLALQSLLGAVVIATGLNYAVFSGDGLPLLGMASISGGYVTYSGISNMIKFNKIRKLSEDKKLKVDRNNSNDNILEVYEKGKK